MTRLASCLLLFAASVALAADPIRFPDVAPPTPTPQPLPAPADPTAPLVVQSDRFFVVQSDEPILPLVSPQGLVRFTADTGPLRVRGVFADGNGQVETRTLTAKHLVFVDPLKAGAGELLVVPVGVQDAAKIERRAITTQVGPTPPGPGPGPAPTPNPVNPAPIPEPGFRVLILFESMEVLPAAQQSILTGKRVRDYLDAKCVTEPDGKTKGYRIWDKDTVSDADLPVWSKAMKRPHGSIPWIIVSNGTTGFEGPLPATVDEALSLLKKYGGE